MLNRRINDMSVRHWILFITLITVILGAIGGPVIYEVAKGSGPGCSVEQCHSTGGGGE